MFVLVSLFCIILSVITLVIALVYAVLANNHIRNELQSNSDGNLNTAQKYSLAAYIILAVSLAFAILIVFGGIWKYRHHMINNEDELPIGYSHAFGALLVILNIAMMVSVPVLLLTAKNNYLQYTTSDVKTLNYLDYAWFLTTASLILFTVAAVAAAIRLNWKNELIDCATDAFSMCRERLQKNRCGMMNAPRGSPMNM